MGLRSRSSRGVTIMVAIGGLGLTALTGAAVYFLVKRLRGSKKRSDSHPSTEILDEASSTSKVSPRIPKDPLKPNSPAGPATAPRHPDPALMFYQDAEEDIDDPWAASTMEGPSATTFKALNTDDLVGLKQSFPTILLDKTLHMIAPEIWRLVMCNLDFHKTFLKFKGCTNIKLGPWMLLKDGAALYEAGQLELSGMAVPAVAPMIHGARRRIEYDGPSNSQNLGTKTVNYVENYTCYMRPNAGMLVHVRTNMLKAAYEKAFEVHHIWLATPIESGKTRLHVSCGVRWMQPCLIKETLTVQINQGMKKSFLLYNRLLDDRLQGQRKLNGQAIPMKGVDSCGDDTSIIQMYMSIAKSTFHRCVRAIYSAVAILPLSVYIVGAALVLLVPSKGLLEGMDSICVHGLPS